MRKGAVTPDINDSAGADRIADIGGVPVIPRRYIQRASLFERLDRARDDRLIIVRGTAGAGKSSLVSAWLRRIVSVDEPVLWITAERSSADRAAVWQAAWRRLRDPLISGGGVSASDDGDMLHPDAVVDELERHPRRLRLVIDDLDLVEPRIVEDIDRLLSHNAQLSVIVTSRATTALESTTIARRHLPWVLEGSQIAFDVSETIAVVLAGDQGFDERDARVIHEATGGWPLGVRLAMLGFAGTDHGLHVGDVAEHIANASEELFAGMDGDRIAFATQVSLPPSVSPELAGLLTGSENARERLDELESAGMGAWRRIEGDRRFVFQPSLRLALEHELERRAPDDVVALRRRVADWEDRRGEPFEALRQLSIIGDLDGMSRLLGRHFTYFSYYHGDATLDLLTDIPRAQLNRYPVLAVMTGMLYARDDPSPSQRVRNLAQLGMTIARTRLGAADTDGDFWTTFALHGAQRLMGQFIAAARSADRLLGIIDAGDAEWLAEAGDGIPSAWVVAATSLLLVGRAEDARRIGERVRPRHGLSRFVSGRSLGAIASVLRGELVEARAITDDIQRTSPAERWRGKYNGVGWHVAEAVLSLERGEWSTALSILSELEPHLANLEQWAFVMWAEGQARLLSGSLAESLETYGTRLSRFRHRPASPFARSLVAATHADLLLAAGQPQRAEAVLARLGRLPHVEISRGRLDLARGELARSLGRLQPVAWTPENAPGDREAGLVLSAVVLDRMGRRADALRAVQHAAALARLHENLRPLMLAPRTEVLQLLEDADAELAQRITTASDPFGGLHRIGTLSRRERLVLNALAETGSLDEIADRLFVSINTVRTQLRSVYRKLGVNSRVDALNVAARNGLLDDPEAAARITSGG